MASYPLSNDMKQQSPRRVLLQRRPLSRGPTTIGCLARLDGRQQLWVCLLSLKRYSAFSHCHEILSNCEVSWSLPGTLEAGTVILYLPCLQVLLASLANKHGVWFVHACVVHLVSVHLRSVHNSS